MLYSFLQAPTCAEEEGKGFIRLIGAVGGDPSRCFKSACWIHALSPRRRASQGAEIVTCSGLNVIR